MKTPLTEKQLKELLNKHKAGTLSEAEEALLNQWYESLEKNEVSEPLTEYERLETRNRLMQFAAGDEKRKAGREIRMFSFSKIAAGFLIIALSAYGIYQYTFKDIANVNTVAAVITPGTDKAILQLADGTKVELNGTGTAIPQQGVAQVTSESGKLSYQVNGLVSEVLYNTISTPRGGQYQLTLSDGSKVWLNAASSLKFPAAFSGRERVVELKGEAYFEVAKNASMPFKVQMESGDQVEVLGTHFNVMAYAEEPFMKTTLLEGSVRVKDGSKSSSVMLSPGQQAQRKPDGNFSVLKNYDVTEAVAWKDNLFMFHDTRLDAIMRQVARWYDVEVSYQHDNLKEVEFGGVFSRMENASAILDLLKLTGVVDFEIEGRKIIVKNAQLK